MTWKRIFKSKMRDEDWLLDTVEIWAIALTDLKITRSELMLAQRKSMALEWPPTAPADFLALARGQAVDNYPDVRQAYIDQANFKSDCPIAYETARRVGFTAMREQPESKTYPAWRKIYAEVCAECSQGAVFTLPNTKAIPMQPKQVKKLTDSDIEALRNALLGGGK